MKLEVNIYIDLNVLVFKLGLLLFCALYPDLTKLLSPSTSARIPGVGHL